MTTQFFLDRLEGVHLRGAGKWSARCPAHQDKSPSLSITQASDRILIHCFAGCGGTAIVAAIGLTMADLFWDAPGSCPTYREGVCRTLERQRKVQRNETDGFTIDALREADYFVRSRQGLNIAAWNHERLNDELDTLADAYALLLAEEGPQWI